MEGSPSKNEVIERATKAINTMTIKNLNLVKTVAKSKVSCESLKDENLELKHRLLALRCENFDLEEYCQKLNKVLLTFVSRTFEFSEEQSDVVAKKLMSGQSTKTVLEQCRRKSRLPVRERVSNRLENKCRLPLRKSNVRK